MRTALAALTLALAAPAALAEATQPVSAVSAAHAARTAAPGFHERMYQRYCDRLREGPEAYAAFVKRMALVTGYTFRDFAQVDDTPTPLRAQCRLADGTLADAGARR